MNRTVLIALGGVVAIAAGGYWYYFIQDGAPPLPWEDPPKKAAPQAAKKDAPKAEAPKPAPQAAAKPEAPKPAAAPVPDDPAALDKAIKDTQAKNSELEKRVADLRKQVDVKNREIEALEKKAAAKK